MKFILYSFVACFLMCFLTNCRTGSNVISNQNVIRQAENTPEYFDTLLSIKLDNQSCKSPMVDSRNGTKIMLHSSNNGLGKYLVPEGTYGVKKGEALLLDCSTGKVNGIVKI